VPAKWKDWLKTVWARLVKGEKVIVPGYVPKPKEAGFRKTTKAEDHGQSADWILPCPDGSRLHIHEHKDGTLRMHRDRYDPDKGVLSAAGHFLFETRWGIAVAVVGGYFAYRHFTKRPIGR
jgi:hypothetical protein